MRENIQTRLEVEEREAEAARERERECAEFMEVRAHHLTFLYRNNLSRSACI